MPSSTVERKRFGGTNLRGGPADAHLRTDRWWIMPLTYVVVLGAFVVYSTYAILVGNNFQITAGGRHILSPFYSPCTADACGADVTPALGAFLGGAFLASRILWMLFPLSFRGTCYYYRKAYYRSFFFSPPACAVAEPHNRYSGERKIPLIVQNTHRLWWFVAVGFIIMLGYDAVISFDFNGSVGMSLGTLMECINVILLALYTFSCHSCRHVVGGRINNFSKHPVRYRLWTWVSKINAQHGMYAWLSLVFVGLTDLYIRMAAAGWYGDPRFF